MSGRKDLAVIAGLMLSASLLAAAFMAVFLNHYYSRIHFRVLGEICQEIVDKKPEAEQAVLAALKEYRQNPAREEKNWIYDDILGKYGYRQADLWKSGEKASRFLIVAGFSGGGLLLLLSCLAKRKREIGRIDVLTDYLENVNTGRGGTLLKNGEDAFARLQDEIYKTVTMLYQTREQAVTARNNFAENLANIAHQIKTPITSISLSIQMMKERSELKYLEQIKGQISRLAHLEEALLLLSRIDAGALPLEKKEVDVFTLLMFAADNLQELTDYAKVSIDIPESGESTIVADLDWTMEAIMNLMKNCIEHTAPEGEIYCSYAQNPLYTQIRIWDRGTGFEKEDLPHLFERFYRGKNENVGSNGIGIGLALSKSVIESQNGTVCAWNLPEGGACFEVRFYSCEQ